MKYPELFLLLKMPRSFEYFLECPITKSIHPFFFLSVQTSSVQVDNSQFMKTVQTFINKIGKNYDIPKVFVYMTFHELVMCSYYAIKQQNNFGYFIVFPYFIYECLYSFHEMTLEQGIRENTQNLGAFRATKTTLDISQFLPILYMSVYTVFMN